MAWDTEIVLRLRYTINDVNSDSYVWNDAQLKVFILMATSFVVSDLSKWGIASAYTIDIVNQTITPDPTDEESDIIVNLITIKAAELIGRAEFKKNSATAGIRIVDDKSTIDTTNVTQNLSKILDAYALAYSEELKRYKTASAFDGRAILAPYTSSVSGIYY